MSMNSDTHLTVGEASIKLLEAYGVDTVFGIPGVHTLEFCKGLNQSPIRHVQARNEQGAGFMADGYARASGKPGVALLISGPGVTNAADRHGPGLCRQHSHAGAVRRRGQPYTRERVCGCLHEVTSLTDATAPLTAFSATAMTAAGSSGTDSRGPFRYSAANARARCTSRSRSTCWRCRQAGDWQAIELPQRPAPTAKKVEQRLRAADDRDAADDLRRRRRHAGRRCDYRNSREARCRRSSAASLARA